jgi:hypothetical protein
MSAKTRTITVAFQMRIPSKMRRSEVENFIAEAISAGPPGKGLEWPKLYRDRIEVFMP